MEDEEGLRGPMMSMSAKETFLIAPLEGDTLVGVPVSWAFFGEGVLRPFFDNTGVCTCGAAGV